MPATVEPPGSRKLHGFSIDALIGRSDDSRRSESRTPPSPVPPRVESSQSPETENRVAAWGEEGLKHFFHGYSSPAEVAASLYQPLRVCNRAISAGSSAFLPPQLSTLPFSPLLYAGLGREFPHHTPHPILTPRYPGFVHPRYHMGPPPSLLFHPYRKPKRNRTAFSPAQLLQLEEAFEKNHYVVGQERKQLASKLQLSETQVKVWFQNRRTKHKRMKAEEEAGEKPGDDAEKKNGDKRESASGSEADHHSDASEAEEDRPSDAEHEEEEEEEEEEMMTGVALGGGGGGGGGGGEEEEEEEEEELCVTDQGDS